MPEIELNDETIPYEVRESEDATRARIDVDLRGVRVTIPAGQERDPERFLRERAEWVVEKYRDVTEFLAALPDRELVDGGSVPFLGEAHTIRVDAVDAAEVGDGVLRLPAEQVESDGVKPVLEEVFRERARDRVEHYLREHEDRVDGAFERVYIRNQKTKWASCSGKDNLSFNYRLMMAPEDIIEYVVVHELVHLEERSHTDAFWRRVGNILPDYGERKRWLDEHGMDLIFSPDDIV